MFDVTEGDRDGLLCLMSQREIGMAVVFDVTEGDRDGLLCLMLQREIGMACCV